MLSLDPNWSFPPLVPPYEMHNPRSVYEEAILPQLEILGHSITYQVGWATSCCVAGAGSTLLAPKRIGFEANSAQLAAACYNCRDAIEYRGREHTFDWENYLLWRVLKTRQVLRVGENSSAKSIANNVKSNVLRAPYQFLKNLSRVVTFGQDMSTGVGGTD